MPDYVVNATRAPHLDEAEVRRRLGKVYHLILSCYANSEDVDPFEDAEIGEPSAAGDTVAAELENE